MRIISIHGIWKVNIQICFLVFSFLGLWWSSSISWNIRIYKRSLPLSPRKNRNEVDDWWCLTHSKFRAYLSLSDISNDWDLPMHSVSWEILNLRIGSYQLPQIYRCYQGHEHWIDYQPAKINQKLKNLMLYIVHFWKKLKSM